MARIHAGNDGVILRWDRYEDVIAPPPGGTRSVDYDPDYNAPITALMVGSWANLRVPANQQLTNNGAAVTINPAGERYQDWQDLGNLEDQLRTYHTTPIAQITNAMSVAAIKAIIRVLRLIVRHLWGRG